MAGVDELMGTGRHVRQDAEPTKGIDPLEGADRGGGQALTRDAVEAVAARDEVGRDRMLDAVLPEGGARRSRSKSNRRTSFAS